MPFPDHHAYDAEDVNRIRLRASGSSVVTTEKDAVKLAPFNDRLPPVFVMRLSVRPAGSVAQLLAAIDSVAARSSSGTSGEELRP